MTFSMTTRANSLTIHSACVLRLHGVQGKIGKENLLIGFFRESNNVGGGVLRTLDITLDRVKAELQVITGDAW